MQWKIGDVTVTKIVELESLGRTKFVLPQATRRMMPPFVNQSVLQLKNTSLLSVVAVPDLMYQGSLIVSETFRPLEIYTSLGVIYLIILYPMQKLAKRLERRDDL